MIYDYIIIGSGIAGCVCAYKLSKNKKTCLILEKENGRFEKICGGGVSYKGLDILREIGIDVDKMINEKISVIKGHIIFNKDTCKIKIYDKNRYSLGVTRYDFDKFLLDEALNKGATIKYGQEVRKIHKENGVYYINGFKGYKIVCAAGARGINRKIPKGQSIGISAQIEGETLLEANKFYYWYYTSSEDKYFWAFPIGKNLWNIGIWFRSPDSTMKRDFEYCVDRYIEKYFGKNYKYRNLPKAEFLGNIDQRDEIFYAGIGDFAGKNNIKNGGGIIGAIESAVEYANGEIARSLD